MFLLSIGVPGDMSRVDKFSKNIYIRSVYKCFLNIHIISITFPAAYLFIHTLYMHSTDLIQSEKE